MNRSESVTKLATALVAIQPLFPTVPKTKIGKIPLKSGGSYSYTYADFADVMDAVKPILNGAGIAVLQLPNGNAIETVLLHESGEWISGTLELVDCTDPQKQGSAITYGRRYSLSAVLGIVTEDDDDGAAATHSAPAASQQQLQASERPSEGPTAYAGARQTQSVPAGEKIDKKRNGVIWYFFNKDGKAADAYVATRFNVKRTQDLTIEQFTEMMGELNPNKVQGRTIDDVYAEQSGAAIVADAFGIGEEPF